MSQEIQPCPFCNSRKIAEASSFIDGKFFRSCRRCGATSPLSTTRQGALDAWNFRPIEKRLQERINESHVFHDESSCAVSELSDLIDSCERNIKHIRLIVSRQPVCPIFSHLNIPEEEVRS